MPASFSTLIATSLSKHCSTLFLIAISLLIGSTDLTFAQGAVGALSSAGAASGNGSAQAPNIPAGTNITLPPGVQIPPGVKIPQGVTINQSPQGNASGNNAPAKGADNNANNPNGNQNINAKDGGQGKGLTPELVTDIAVPNAFQNFLKQITGKEVGIYGRNLFARTNPFSALESVPVPTNYVLGPGDEVNLKIYSPAFDIDQRFVINKDGSILLPKIGPVPLAGTKVGDAEGAIKNYLSRMLTNFNVYVTVGQLKGIEIYVVGQTPRPGKYIVSSVSSMINALFATGGPSSNGSMRNIELVRQGKVVGVVDLYPFLLNGDTSRDLILQAGDVIRIPPVGAQIAMLGAIPDQAIYELNGREQGNSLANLIRYAGTVSVFTSPLQVTIERIDPNSQKPLSALAISLDKSGLETRLKDGDIVTFLPIKPAFSNAVSLRLLGAPSVRLPIKPGTTIHDLIPNKEALLTNLYFLRRFTPPGSSAGASDDMSRIREGARLDQINWDHALLERINLRDLSPQVISFNLEQAIAGTNPRDNIELQPGDIITIFSQKDMQVPSDRQTRVVKVEGEVKSPGIYQLKRGETLPDVIERAGGATGNAYIFGIVLSRESVRQQQQKNLDKIIQQMQNQMQYEVKSSTSFSTDNDAARMQGLALLNAQNLQQKIEQLKNMNPNGRLSLELDPNDPQIPEIALEDGDQILIPREPSSVGVYGAVYNESGLLYRDGKKVDDYLASAGVTVSAERSWTFLLRADGSIRAPDTSGWYTSGTIGSLIPMPGDAIVVPEKVIRETGYSSFMRGLKDWTSIFFNIGLGAAAISVMK